MSSVDVTQRGAMSPLYAELSRYESLRQQRLTLARRRHRRFVVRGDAVLQPLQPLRRDGGPIRIMLRDVAPGGVGFVCTTSLAVNSMWRASFLDRQYPVAQQPLLIGHCSVLQEGVFLLGGPFCAETGLLCVLGVDPGAISNADGPALPGETAFDQPPPAS